MILAQSSNYKSWLLLVAVLILIIGVAAGGYYYYTANKPITTSISPDPALQQSQVYRLITEADRELVLIEGIVTNVTLEQTENTSFPDQHFVTLRNQSLPHATFKISLGPPQRPLRVRYPQREAQPGLIIDETVEVSQLVQIINPGEFIGVELSFPLDQPEVKSAFMTELNQFSQTIANDQSATFDVHYFRTHRVIINE